MKPDEIPDEVVAAAKRADHEEGVRDGRSYHEVADHQVRRLIAGAVAAERERAEAGHAEYLARLSREMDETVRAEYQRGAAAERQRLAQLAGEVGATFRSTYSFTERQSKILKFADLIREDPP